MNELNERKGRGSFFSNIDFTLISEITLISLSYEKIGHAEYLTFTTGLNVFKFFVVKCRFLKKEIGAEQFSEELKRHLCVSLLFHTLCFI